MGADLGREHPNTNKRTNNSVIRMHTILMQCFKKTNINAKDAQ